MYIYILEHLYLRMTEKYLHTGIDLNDLNGIECHGVSAENSRRSYLSRRGKNSHQRATGSAEENCRRVCGLGGGVSECDETAIII